MILFDTILIVILAGFVFYGLFFGFIKMIGNLIAIIIGALIASHYYLVVFDWLEGIIGSWGNFGKVLAFIIVFGLASKIIRIAFSVLEKIFHMISFIPFLKGINRLLGGLFGLVEGIIVVGLVLYVTSRYSLIESLIGGLIAESQVASFLVRSIDLISPLFPDALVMLESIV